MIERYTLPEMGRLWSDSYKYEQWLRVELAVCEAWTQQGVIPAEDMAALRKATVSASRVAEIERETDHDLIAFVRAAGETIGPERRWLHLGLTSSDVVDTGLSLTLLVAVELLCGQLETLEQVLTEQALRYRDTPTIGRTHGVHAEPTTFGYKLLVWLDETRRNISRLSAVGEELRVGKLSGSVGTHANIPPEAEESALRSLGLRPAAVATQVLGRDLHAHLLSTLALIGACLEKYATEIRHLQRTEVREAEQPFGQKQQGSSAMPHKRNPEKMERVAGLARVLRAYAGTGLENVALWHERDISHSSTERITLPGACTLLYYMLDLMISNLRDLRVYPERMLQNLNLTGGLVYSQRVLLALVDAGLDRQEAYKLVQRAAMESWETGTPFRSLLEREPLVVEKLGGEGLDAAFSLEPHLRHVGTAYDRLGLEERG
ncbi:MAG: adenylosuccinate lyase [Chloroflexota bacterium]|nr:adenylosuccinate lyase [Chloroflexota bacterium]